MMGDIYTELEDVKEIVIYDSRGLECEVIPADGVEIDLNSDGKKPVITHL